MDTHFIKYLLSYQAELENAESAAKLNSKGIDLYSINDY